MRTLTAMCLLFTIASSSTASDRFYLTDPASGAKYGPFRFRDGETVSIGTRELVVAKVMTQEEQVVERMKAVVIPELDFRNASVHDVVEYLTTASVEFDTSRDPSLQRGINTVMNLQAEPTTVDDADPFAATAIARQPAPPTITFKAHYISLYEALNVITRLTHLKWSITGSCVIIEPDGGKHDPTTESSSPEAAQSSPSNER